MCCNPRAPRTIQRPHLEVLLLERSGWLQGRQQAQEQQGTGMKLPAVRQERQRTGVDALQVPAPSYWRPERYKW